jgi:tRNA-specific 2-thiouridylase
MKKKVVVAMSGGIDSSVAAALLKGAGFDVIGIFMIFWSEKTKDKRWNVCCSPGAQMRAREVAKKLSIPFYVLDLRKEFKEKIVDYFLKEMKKGTTPNPCVECNRFIKFGMLLKKTKQLGADFLATGHYARIKKEAPRSKYQMPIYKLLKAKDKAKDQSYFLWRLTQKQLKHLIFPLGDFTKKEVLKFAKKFDLPVLGIPESQEICFVGKSLEEFLKKYLKSKPGKIVDKDGNILGKHKGLIFYTIGQRKGIGLSGGSWYVLEKDTKNNLLIVTKKERDLYKKEFIAKEINWISGRMPSLPIRAKAKIRYLHPPASATIYPYKQGQALLVKVVFDKPQRAITPGQSVVFYKREEVLGGGIIKKVTN